jgi:hypothetical protein
MTAVDSRNVDAREVDAAVAIDAAGDVASACSIHEGPPLVLDGNGDLAKYAPEQHVPLGAMLGADDAALTWDASRLYVTMTSDAFASSFEPIHVYLETGAQLAAPQPAAGKEYGGLIANLPFTPTHLLGARQVDDSGTGPYDAVFLPDAAWTTREMPLVPGTDVFVSPDHRTISMQAAWSALGGCPTSVRVAFHVVHGVAGNEWKDLAPTTHTPWLASGGGFYEIDLTGVQAVSTWTMH